MVGSQDQSDDMTCCWKASSLACYERNRAAMDITENAQTRRLVSDPARVKELAIVMYSSKGEWIRREPVKGIMLRKCHWNAVISGVYFLSDVTGVMAVKKIFGLNRSNMDS